MAPSRPCDLAAATFQATIFVKIRPPRQMVGLQRFELSTSRLSSARSNQLSYRPGKRGRRPNEERETKAAGVPQAFAGSVRFQNRSRYSNEEPEGSGAAPDHQSRFI